jgi:hypothetical protein
VIHRVLISVVAVAVALALACVNMSAPSGPASISELRPPSPSLIVGDTMRDSTGTAAPLTITAFDANMQQTAAVGSQFFITDTTKSATLTGSNLLIGNHLGSTVIIGQIGKLQTSPKTLPVTNRPSKLVKTSLDSLLVAPFTVDTAVSATSVVSLNVLSAQDSASQGIIVRYTLVRTLAARNQSRPAVIIADANGKPGAVDTSQAGGASSRHILVFPALLGDAALLSGSKTDSIIVEARASYAKAALSNSPISFIIPVRVSSQP